LPLIYINIVVRENNPAGMETCPTRLTIKFLNVILNHALSVVEVEVKNLHFCHGDPSLILRKLRINSG
jgi:hypothetical protein